MKRHLILLIAVFVCMGLLIGCSKMKETATSALKTAEDSVKGINKEDATKYAADKFSSIEKSIAAAKESITSGDFKSALASVKDIPAQAQEVAKAIADGKKAELAKMWEGASAGLPKIFEQIQSRISILSKSKAKKASADEAAAGLEAVKKQWADAQELYKSGKLVEVSDSIKSIKGKTAQLLTGLGMPVPATLN
ncbi:MAG: hypothetical protein JXR79_03100 [Nitrospirae bacterium]|nr:hypothetical protein [Nitrospirota bacterium]